MVIADVVDLVGRERKTVFAIFLFGGVLHDSDNTFHDVIDIGKIALALAVIENLDGLACLQFVGEAEIGHVGATSGAVDSKEAKSCARDVVEFAVGVRHEFVALLGGGVQRNRVIDLVISGVRDFLVAAIHAGGAGIHEVFDFKMPARF